MNSSEKIQISKKTKIIFKEEDKAEGFYIVKKGIILQFKLKKERLIPLSFLGPKDFFGVEDVIGANKRNTTAIDINGDAELIEIRKEDIDKFLNLSPAWSKQLLINLSSRITKARELLSDNQIVDEKLIGNISFTPEMELKLKKLMSYTDRI